MHHLLMIDQACIVLVQITTAFINGCLFFKSMNSKSPNCRKSQIRKINKKKTILSFDKQTNIYKTILLHRRCFVNMTIFWYAWLNNFRCRFLIYCWLLNFCIIIIFLNVIIFIFLNERRCNLN